MKPNHIVINHKISRFSEAILVSNYEETNKIINLPCIANSCLLSIKDTNTVGVWKIKNLK